MRIPVIVYTAAVVFIFSLHEEKVSGQVFSPSIYGGGPLSYGNADSDDDFGVLLALLLLATRNRGGNSCCCNPCNNVRTVPVPFPIPFPTNNPIIQTSFKDNDEPSSNSDRPSETINFNTENEQETTNESTVKNNPKNTVKSSSNSDSTANNRPGKTNEAKNKDD